MTVRRAEEADWARILEIYAIARASMENNGNPTQWCGGHPSTVLLRSDLDGGRLYVCVEGVRVHGVFAFILGDDPSYRELEGGRWLNEEPYGAIHRLASGGEQPGVFRTCLAFCLEKIKNIRIDTHEDNRAMRHILGTSGFILCGVIHVSDGASDHSPRFAYQYAG